MRANVPSIRVLLMAVALDRAPVPDVPVGSEEADVDLPSRALRVVVEEDPRNLLPAAFGHLDVSDQDKSPGRIDARVDHATRLAKDGFRDPWADADTRLDGYLDGATRAKAARSMRDDAARAGEALAHIAAGRVPAAFARWAVVFGHEFQAYG